MNKACLWDREEDPNGNVRHIAEHGLTREDVESVLSHADRVFRSRSSGRPCVFGFTPLGEYIIVMFVSRDPETVYPVTAYPVPQPKR
jgi:uncharacterized DUF497 family protein